MWTPTVNQALRVAAKLHAGQVRRDDGTPYISHPVAVMLLASRYTDDEAVLCGALLHDILEDVPSDKYDTDDMRRDFGERVTRLVQTVSDPPATGRTSKEREDQWRQRKMVYLRQIRTCDDDGALLISAADLYHNTFSFLDYFAEEGESFNRHFHRDKAERIWFATERFAILEPRIHPELAASLQEILTRYRQVLE